MKRMDANGDAIALFHSFPRVGDHYARAAILRSIVTRGLLLVPECVEFPSQRVDDGLEIPAVEVWQRRFCLTALGRGELRAHSSAFGDWAIEFSLSGARTIGAIPVFYVPSSATDESDTVRSYGAFLVHRLHEVGLVLDDLSRIEADGDVGGLVGRLTQDRADFDTLAATVQSLMGLFYHVSRSDVEGLEYFRQREWRVLTQVVESSPSVQRRAVSASEAAELRDLAPVFSRRMRDRKTSYAEESIFLESVHGVPIRDLIVGVHVPTADYDEAVAIVRSASLRESLVRAI